MVIEEFKVLTDNGVEETSIKLSAGEKRINPETNEVEYLNDGLWIANITQDVISKELWLGKNDSPDNYIEITDEEKQAIEIE